MPNVAYSRSRWSVRSSSRGRRSESALTSLPMLLEVAHERRAEVAVRLLAAERRHVPAKRVERLGADAQRTPVARRVDETGARQRLDARRDRRVHLLRRLDGLVAEQVAVRRAGLELETGEDRLAREPVSDGAG